MGQGLYCHEAFILIKENSKQIEEFQRVVSALKIIKQSDVAESEHVWGGCHFIGCSGKAISEWMMFDLKRNIKKEPGM